ncbi:hypothetical protein JW998_17320 [candidate division KSB1 bacterium]|nr:hypothetical protein [candidate division KSB1 bacterium]
MNHVDGPCVKSPVPLRVLAIAGFAVVGLLIAAGMALLFGLVLMWLWNWLMPVIFGLPAITFWQAWGLIVLSHILFKTFPHNGHSRRHDEEWKRKFKERLTVPASHEKDDNK